MSCSPARYHGNLKSHGLLETQFAVKLSQSDATSEVTKILKPCKAGRLNLFMRHYHIIKTIHSYRKNKYKFLL